MIIYRTLLLSAGLLIFTTLFSQEESMIYLVDASYFTAISDKAEGLNKKLDKQIIKALRNWQKQEAWIYGKLHKIDSLKAANLVESLDQGYNGLQQKNNDEILNYYIPSLDTISSSLKFLNENPALVSQLKNAPQKLSEAIEKAKGLQNSFQRAEEVKRFLREYQQYLRDQLGNLGFAKELKKFNKQAYYFSEQLEQYKSILKDHRKAERKALDLLNNTKLFKDFMRKNSQLASLFRLPGSDPSDPVSTSLLGLQTRSQVNGIIQQQLGAGGSLAQEQFTQNVRDAQSQLGQLKDRVTKAGRSSSDDIMPKGYKPNNQRTKNFWQRLEVGTNLQSQKDNRFFPVTSDIGVSLGYKLNDKSVAGIGASYKVGWGHGFRDINITHQGVGLRSFVDWKIKGSFWATGGFELNYRNEFNRINVLKELDIWQQSGLIGFSKVVSIRSKFFSNTNIKLLWDFLSYRQIPRTQPVVFRIGYTIK